MFKTIRHGKANLSVCWQDWLKIILVRLPYLFWIRSALIVSLSGLIDWNPYLPEIFTKLLRGFGLKIVTGTEKSTVSVGSSAKNVEAEVVCQFLTSIMGGDSECLAYVSRLFLALESYYHPSNFGS